MPRSAHRVAIVVFCEAEGVDERDAAAGAEMAIAHALRQAAETGPDAQAKVASSRAARCGHCGADAGVDPDGAVNRHILGEPFFPDPDPNSPDYRPEPCPGTGQPAQPDTHPIVGLTRTDGLGLYARIHDTMEAGMALGNGYLWAGVTRKAFRF